MVFSRRLKELQKSIPLVAPAGRSIGESTRFKKQPSELLQQVETVVWGAGLIQAAFRSGSRTSNFLMNASGW
jgi:hypothetical protein